MFIIQIIALVLAIAATVCTFIFLVPDKKRDKLNKFWKFIHDTVNFKFLIVEKVLQAMYILLTAYVFLQGFLMLFYYVPGYNYYGYRVAGQWYGGQGILIMLLGPIAVRIMYELIMMAILLVKNVIQINNKLKASDDSVKHDIFATPKFATPAFAKKVNDAAPAPVVNNAAAPLETPVAPVVEDEPAVETAPVAEETPAAPVTNPAFCSNCGAKLDENAAFCTSCGTKIN